MRNLLFIFLAIVALSCNDDDNINETGECIAQGESFVITNDCVDNSICEFNIFDDSRVDISVFDGVASGDSTVFQISITELGDLNVDDDETQEFLVFQFVKGQVFSSLFTNDFRDIRLYYRFSDGFGGGQFIEVNDGCMIAELQDDGSYIIEGSLNIPLDGEVIDFKFDTTFDRRL